MEKAEVEVAATIERGGCVVCKAAASVEVRAAACSTNQPRARHHRAPLSHDGSLAVRTHLRLEGCLDPSASKLQVGEDGRGEGGALQKGLSALARVFGEM